MSTQRSNRASLEELPEAGERLEAVGRRFVVAPSLWSPPPPPPPLEPLPPPRLLLEDRSFACQLYAGLLSVHWPPPGSVAILHSSLALRPPEPLNRAQVSEDRAVHGQSDRYGLSFSVNVSQCQCFSVTMFPSVNVSQCKCFPVSMFLSVNVLSWMGFPVPKQSVMPRYRFLLPVDPHVDTMDPNVN